jgi:hypothetical protein
MGITMGLFLILMSPEEDGGGGSAVDDLVTIPREELEALRARAELASDVARATEERAEDARSLLQARDSARKPLVAGAASQLIHLWRDDFDIVDDGGQVRILARDGRGVEQLVADRLTGPEFAHFCIPTSRGGTGARGQNPSARPAPPPASPRSLGEAALMRWRDATPTPGGLEGAGWGRR